MRISSHQHLASSPAAQVFYQQLHCWIWAVEVKQWRILFFFSDNTTRQEIPLGVNFLQESSIFPLKSGISRHYRLCCISQVQTVGTIAKTWPPFRFRGLTWMNAFSPAFSIFEFSSNLPISFLSHDFLRSSVVSQMEPHDTCNIQYIHFLIGCYGTYDQALGNTALTALSIQTELCGS